MNLRQWLLAVIFCFCCLSGGWALQRVGIFENTTLAPKVILHHIQYEEKVKGTEIKAELPKLAGLNSQVVQNLINRKLAEIVFADIYNFRRASYKSEKPKKLGRLTDLKDSYWSDTGVACYTKEYISVAYYVTTFWCGAAHPLHNIFTMNFLLKDGKLLKVADLFKPGSRYLKFLSEYCIRSLEEQFGRDGEDEWVRRGAAAKADNFQRFFLLGDKLRVVFTEYQVAPYCSGEQEVDIPFEEIPAELGFKFGVVTPEGGVAVEEENL
jgi:hypothetical protein